MASRVRIAAAGCAVASGLFMAGASATIAFADPESGQGGESGGTQASGSTGTGSTESTGTATDDPSGATPTTQASVPVIVTATTSKPTAGSATASTSASKQPEVNSQPPSQTVQAPAGEPVNAVAARLADPSNAAVTPTQTTTAVPPPSTEQAAGALAAENPNDPNDPKDPDDPEEHQPGFGWPWWGPCPDPDDPGEPGGPGLPPGNDGGAQVKPPSGRPNPPPAMQLPLPREVPPELPNISADPVIDAVTGVATAAAELAFVPITLPVIVAPIGAGGAGGAGGSGGAGGGGAGSRAGTPSAPKNSSAPQKNEPPQKAGPQNPPAFSAGSGAPPESFRVGYGNYLRTAGVGQMMAVAIPGVTGILVLTGAGGLLGYRQAKAGRAVRAGGTGRFVG